jgi:hypothetical protein
MKRIKPSFYTAYSPLRERWGVFFIIFSLCLTSNVFAGTDKLACASIAEQNSLGGLPDFNSDTTAYLGYRCDLQPRVSSFLGNWLPSLPSISIFQANKIRSSDFHQGIKFELAIKRIGHSQLYFSLGQTKSQQVLSASEDIPFVSVAANDFNDAVNISKDQKARLSQEKTYWGLGFKIPYQDNQPLTGILFQQSKIDQPIQANIPTFEKRSLFQAQAHISELSIISESRHRGLNFNWQFGLGMGKVILEPSKVIHFSKDLDQIMTLKGMFEIYYQYRISRRWYAYSSWQSHIRYWQQMTNDDEFQLAPNNQLTHQGNIGFGLSF